MAYIDPHFKPLLETRVISAASEHISMIHILQDILDTQGREHLGSYQVLMGKIMDAIHHETETLDIALGVAMQSLFKDQLSCIKLRQKAMTTHFGQCQLCKRLLHIRAMTEEEQDEKIVIFYCKHAYHETCLEHAIALVVSHPVVYQKDTLWCVTCGCPPDELQKARKGKASHRSQPPSLAQLDDISQDTETVYTYLNRNTSLVIESHLVYRI